MEAKGKFQGLDDLQHLTSGAPDDTSTIVLQTATHTLVAVDDVAVIVTVVVVVVIVHL